MIGFSLGGEESRYCVVDAAGEILEEGSTESTEAAMRRLFASLPPSAIAVEWGPQTPALLAALQGQEHLVFLSGPAPAHVVAAFRSKVETVLESRPASGAAAVVAWHQLAREDDAVALRLMFAAGPDGEIGGWYFIGPISADTDLGQLSGIASAGGANPAAAEQARRLEQLFKLGNLSLARSRRAAA